MSGSCTSPQPISVRGGSNGIEAHYDSIAGMARLLGSAATHLTETSLQAVAVLGSPTLVATSVLDPGGAALFESALLTTVNLPGGLIWQAGRCGALDVSVRGAALAYMEADRFGSQVLPAVKGVENFPAGLAAAVPKFAAKDFKGGFGALAVRDPAVADSAVDAVTVFWTNPAAHARVASYPDGRPVVASEGVDHGADVPPKNLPDLLTELSRRNNAGGAQIDVRFVESVGPDGRPQRRVIVDIPGSHTFSPQPGPDPTSLGGNLRSIDGNDTAYEEGVIEAMRLAGVTKEDQVMMVGHSQGGMVAVNAARQVTNSGEFTVTNVVTVGSPIARLQVPRSVQVLAVENSADVVPQADGADNQDRTNVTTVTVNHNNGSVDDNHDIDKAYIPGARDIEASNDPSVKSVLASMKPFLNGASVQTKAYSVTRVMPGPVSTHLKPGR